MRAWKWVATVLAVVAGMVATELMMPRGTGLLVGEAVAQNRPTGGGDYVVAAGRTTDTAQLLYVVDTRVKKLMVYGVKQGRNVLEPVDMRDLNREFPGGCSGQVVLQPFEVASRAEAVAIIDTVNKKMVVYVSYNYGRLTMMGVADLAKDMGT